MLAFLIISVASFPCLANSFLSGKKQTDTLIYIDLDYLLYFLMNFLTFMALFNQEYKVIYLGFATEGLEHSQNHILKKQTGMTSMFEDRAIINNITFFKITTLK